MGAGVVGAGAARAIQRLLNHYDVELHRCTNYDRLVAVPYFILDLVSILVRREHGWHFDHDRDFSAAFGSDSAKKVLLIDLKLVLTAAKDQVGVLWPAEGPIVLDDELLVDALTCPHPVVIWVLHAHETHG